MAGNKKPRKKFKNTSCKLKTNTPINIRYDLKGDQRLKLPPQISLEEFKRGEGHQGAWDTLFFRIQVGKQLSKHFTKESIVTDFDHGIWLLNKFKDYFTKTGNWVTVPENIDDLRDILLEIDSMQDNTTRRDQLEAYNYVYKFIHIDNKQPQPEKV